MERKPPCIINVTSSHERLVSVLLLLPFLFLAKRLRFWGLRNSAPSPRLSRLLPHALARQLQLCCIYKASVHSSLDQSALKIETANKCTVLTRNECTANVCVIPVQVTCCLYACLWNVPLGIPAWQSDSEVHSFHIFTLSHFLNIFHVLVQSHFLRIYSVSLMSSVCAVSDAVIY